MAQCQDKTNSGCECFGGRRCTEMAQGSHSCNNNNNNNNNTCIHTSWLLGSHCDAKVVWHADRWRAQHESDRNDSRPNSAAVAAIVQCDRWRGNASGCWGIMHIHSLTHIHSHTHTHTLTHSPSLSPLWSFFLANLV